MNEKIVWLTDIRMSHDLPQDVNLLSCRLQHLLRIVRIGGSNIDNLRRVFLSTLLVDATSNDRRYAAINSREKLLIECIGDLEARHNFQSSLNQIAIEK